MTVTDIIRLIEETELTGQDCSQVISAVKTKLETGTPKPSVKQSITLVVLDGIAQSIFNLF